MDLRLAGAVALALALAGCAGGCPSEARCLVGTDPFPDVGVTPLPDIPVVFDAGFRPDVELRPRCPEGLFCPPRCVDLSVDPQNCGDCGRACGPRFACVGGQCTCEGPGLTVCGDACAVLATDPLHCGECGRQCAAGAQCLDGRCRVRAVEPRLGSSVGSRRPRFRWVGGAGRVQVCRDAFCRQVAVTLDGFSGRATPTEDLAPGRYFWRVGALDVVDWGPAWSFRIDRRGTTAQGTLAPRPDLDGDGLHDVVVTAPGAGRVLVFAGGLARTEPAWSIATHSAANAPRGTQALGDLDGDGTGELLVIDDVRAWIALGRDRGASPVATDLFGRGAAVAGDTDLDGRVEIAWIDSPASLSVHEQDAALSGWELVRRTFAAVTTVIAPGDVDGDAVGDLVSDPTDGRLSLFSGSTEGFASVRHVDAFERATVVESAGDVDGDGLADVLVPAPAMAGARVFYGGTPPFMRWSRVSGLVGEGPRPSAVGDVDGDGFSDVLALAPARGEVRLYRGRRGELSDAPVTLALAAAVEAEAPAVALGDVDGDGCDDVALPAPSRDTVHVAFGGPERPFARVVTLRGEAGSRFGASVE